MTGHGPSHLWCPACGWFGRRARRAARRHSEAALVRFHVKLANDIRADRRHMQCDVLKGLFADTPDWPRRVVNHLLTGSYDNIIVEIPPQHGPGQ